MTTGNARLATSAEERGRRAAGRRSRHRGGTKLRMCGIIGYTGPRQALPIIVDGLGRLEYRGYDSAGIALVGADGTGVQKCEGRLSRLVDRLNPDWQGSVGIGHTRWATHGAPSDANAHPHIDCSGSLALVHNGIIENYLELKQQLIEQGHCFTSETDTEVAAHLIEHHLASVPSADHADGLEVLAAAVRAAIKVKIGRAHV